GVDSSTWADETDVRPTLMALTGLSDDYVSDGRVLFEDVSRSLLPPAYGDPGRRDTLADLEYAYKQINADVGAFGVATLEASTKALESTSAGDHTYWDIENALATLGAKRDALARNIAEALYDLEFHQQPIANDTAADWTARANALIAAAAELGASE
ncbi:MAG: hypothetical protein JOZ92_04355, partial [Candidatus Dormibacteraeota bacterium]|nr:hypothetical protein [Candidatus Dormibacteraeota bacterium]